MGAVDRLTKLLREHVDKFTQQGEKCKEDLVTMEGRLDGLGKDMSNYLTLAQAWRADSGTFDTQVVQEHIVGIRASLGKAKEMHDSKLQEVHKAAKDLKTSSSGTLVGEGGKAKVQSVAEQSKAVEEYAERGSMQTYGLMLMMIIAVAGLACLFL